MTNLKLPTLREMGAKNGFTKEDLIAVIPDGIVMVQDILVKLFGDRTSPIPVTKEVIASILSMRTTKTKDWLIDVKRYTH
jgi:hypothetical protein